MNVARPPLSLSPAWSLLALSFLVSQVIPGAGQAASLTNIVFILADDLGQRDLGSYGSTFHETRALDRLASEGIRFTDAYAACPVCSPTRASILTGLWPQRIGITDFIAPANANGPENWKRNTPLLPAPNRDRLPLDQPTLASLLKRAGYVTFFAGKWHLGPEGHWPENHGFDFNLGGQDRGGPYGGNGYFSPYGNPRLSDGQPGEHLPDRLAEETSKFIRAHRDRPFFAYFSFYSVHTPLMAREDLRRKYEAKRREFGLGDKWGREHPRDVRQVQSHAIYAAMVEAMDLAVGKVLATLDECGLRDSTLVIFTSDNGGLSTSEGWPTSNEPFRAGKGWIYEGGIREPVIIRWPGIVTAGSVTDIPVSSPDFLPTLLEAAGVGIPSDLRPDGVSLLPVLRGGTLPDRSLFWHYPHYGNQGGAPAAAVRQQAWKLIEWMEDQRVELYHLPSDPSESLDLSRQEPARVETLRAELRAWQSSVGATFPRPNPSYHPSAPSGRRADRPAGPVATPPSGNP
ncbi:MAG: sulfatase [Opitutaceae bacterium]